MRRFYRAMCVVKTDSVSLEKVVYNLVSFFQGGVSRMELLTMPLPELFRIEKHAVRINDETKAAFKKKD